MTESYPSNSYSAKDPKKPKAKEEKKVVERVVTGEVVRQKKSLGKKFSETFFGGDTKGVFAYVFMDVMLPAAKDMMVDAIETGARRTILGEHAVSSVRRSSRNAGPYTSYNQMSKPHPAGRAGGERQMSRAGRARHNFDEIVLPTRVEADEVLEQLYALVGKYEEATVGDLYALVGEESSHTDEKWGWTDLRGSGVSRQRGGGYLLNLPKPEPID